MRYDIFFVGNAGCGKTSLAYAFNRWLNDNGVPSIVSNLDPASEYFPYTPDFDIKKFIDVRNIMVEEGLGPNGAILRAVDLMSEQVDTWIGHVDRLGGQIRVIDTPGQLEVLLYRDSGPKLFDKMCCGDRAIGVYLVESRLANDPLSLSVLLMQATITKVRLNLPLTLVVSKADLGVREDVERLLSDMRYLEDKVAEEGKSGQKDSALLLCRALSQMPWQQRYVSVSAWAKTGLKDLYDIVNEALCVCGDLT
ncbi:MAG: ATP/GTP-binding protein [Nitrososphaeria archaeon]